MDLTLVVNRAATNIQFCSLEFWYLDLICINLVFNLCYVRIVKINLRICCISGVSRPVLSMIFVQITI